MIYTDALDRPAPGGIITYTSIPPCTVWDAGVSKVIPASSYWYLSVSSNAPDMRWDGDITPDIIIAEMDAAGWDATIEYPHYGCPPVIIVTHRETAAAAIRQTEYNTPEYNGYIRYEDIPVSGYSRNHATGCPEPGVSVYRAQYDDNGRPVTVGVPDTDAAMCCYIGVSSRPAYRVYGMVVGTGSDGEPCLKIEKIEKL